MENPDLSLAFYHYLCDVIGTEDVVKMRKHILTTIDNVNSDKDITFISSGSKAEGLDLDGSDFDLMILLNRLPVYENKYTVRQLSETLPYVMDTSDCKPGFTQIKQYDTGYVDPCCEFKAGVGYWSSTTFRDEYKPTHLITHGPCNTLQGDGIEVDYAKCLRCSTWISQAKPWISRSRHLRASNAVIKAILDFGVLFVPVGCKNSPNIDFEWRISFSHAEKLLIWSFNHVQLLCYALLKILLKDIIKKTTGDLLCSYFLKTVMLWICEETQSSKWKANNILSCFMNCFNRLVYFVKNRTLMHYFIPDNDLFAERFDAQQHNSVLSTLNQLQSLGWTCLLQTQTLGSFRCVVEPVISSLSSLINTVSYYPNLLWLQRYAKKNSFLKLKQCVYCCMQTHTKDIYIYMMSMLNRDISQTFSKDDRRWSGNKRSYNIYRKRLCHLLLGLNNDAVSGWLLLASHFYVNKQYEICKEILTDCLVKCTPDKILLAFNPPIEEQTRFNCMSEMITTSPFSMIRHHIICHVEFNPSSQIRPNEMDVLDDGTSIFVSPVVLSIFLKYLCDHHLGIERSKNESLHDLELVVQNRYFIINKILLEEAHMLLSIAYSMTDNAMVYRNEWQKSIIQPKRQHDYMSGNPGLRQIQHDCSGF